MRGSLKVGRIAGIAVEIHYTWVFIFALVTYLLAGGMLRMVGSPLLAWLLAVGTSLVFFGSVLAHELAHSVVANSYGDFVQRITLFAFGGVAHLREEPPKGVIELWIALAGPGMSLALAAVFGGIAVLLQLVPGAVAVAHYAAFYLSAINLTLAVFNMIPAYPLDGGRVLRAIIWIATGRFDRATQIAAWIGQTFGWLLMGYGVLQAFSGPASMFNGLWLLAIGWMLSSAAQGSLRRLAIEFALAGATVGEIMTAPAVSAEADWSLQRVVYEIILPHKIREVPVTWGGQIMGVVSANAVQHIPQSNWPLMSVTQIMQPVAPERVLPANAPAIEALRVVGAGLGRAYVVDPYNVLVGVVSEHDLMHAIQIGTLRQQAMRAGLGSQVGTAAGYQYPVPPAIPPPVASTAPGLGEGSDLASAHRPADEVPGE